MDIELVELTDKELEQVGGGHSTGQASAYARGPNSPTDNATFYSDGG